MVDNIRSRNNVVPYSEDAATQIEPRVQNQPNVLTIAVETSSDTANIRPPLSSRNPQRGFFWSDDPAAPRNNPQQQRIESGEVLDLDPPPVLQNVDSTEQMLNVGVGAMDEPSSNDEYSVMRRTGSLQFLREMRQQKSMQQYSTFKLSVLALSVALILCTVNFALARNLTPMNTHLYLQQHQQLLQDWQTLPFVAVEVIKEIDGSKTGGCSPGYEPLFSRTWPGTHDLCESQEVGDEAHKVCESKTSSETERVKKGIEAYEMSSFNGAMICGKRGGKSFVEQTRVRPYKRTCANGMRPCSYRTSQSETICVEADRVAEECPILDMLIISKDQVEEYKRLRFEILTESWQHPIQTQSSNSGLDANSSFEAYFAYSKEGTRGGVSMEPIIGTAMNTAVPCFGPETQQSLILEDSELIKQTQISFEKEEILTQCPYYEWLKSQDRSSRYTQVGTIDLYNLQKSNAIISSLQSQFEQSEASKMNAQIEARRQVNLKLFARKRYQWEIQCEQFSQTSSTTFYRTLKRLSFYFYTDEQIKGFPSLLTGHVHGSEEEALYSHDPTHNGEVEFHMHHNLIHPDVAREQIIFLQVIVLAYYVAVIVIFIVHIVRQPRIQDSAKHLKCQQLKYWLLWLPMTLVVIACEILIIRAAILVSEYWYGWLEALQQKRSSYGCTEASLELDLGLIQRQFEEQGHHLSPPVILIGTIGLILLTLGEFCCHYKMMMRWFIEHPLDGNAVARKIKVGLPPDAPDVPAEQEQIKRDSPQLGHAVPEADREVKKEPLSVQRCSSIPGIEMEDLESLRPVMLQSSVSINGANYSAGAIGTRSRRSSMPPVGIDCDKPYGQSPFCMIEEMAGQEVSLSSNQNKTLSRANLIPSGVGLFQSRDMLNIQGGGGQVSSGIGGETSRLTDLNMMQSTDKVLKERLDKALGIKDEYNNEVEEIFAHAMHTSRSGLVDEPYQSDMESKETLREVQLTEKKVEKLLASRGFLQGRRILTVLSERREDKHDHTVSNSDIEEYQQED